MDTPTSWSRRYFPYTAAVFRVLTPRRLIRTAAALILLAVTFWTVESLRGRYRWIKIAGEVHASGDNMLSFRLHPAPVPDHLNATRHPALAVAIVPSTDEFGYQVDFARLLAPATDGIPDDLDLPATAHPRDLLAATAAFAGFVDRLHDAFARPHSHWFTFPPDPARHPVMEPFPSITNATAMAERFTDLVSRRARAHLDLGDPTSAAHELVTVITLLRNAAPGSTFLDHVITRDVLDAALPELASVIVHPGWDTAGLLDVTAALDGIDLLDHMHNAFLQERAEMVALIRHQYLGRAGITARGPDTLADPRVLYPMRGLRDHNAATLARWWEEFMLPYYDPASGRVDPGPHPRFRRCDIRITPYNVLAAMSFPNITADLTCEDAARLQTTASLIVLLGAAERYRLDHAHHPATLGELVPDYIASLPTDPITGLPPHYATTAAGALTLATLDWDRTGDPATFMSTISIPAPPTTTAPFSKPDRSLSNVTLWGDSGFEPPSAKGRSHAGSPPHALSDR